MSIRVTRFLFPFLAAGIICGAAAASGGQKNKLDPESEKFYQEVRLIMSGEENKIFKLLPDAESRKEFIQDFWDKRDPNPDTPDNEFKTEYELRVAYANKRFHEGGQGMNTDRGRVWIFMGPPDKVEESFNPQNGLQGSPLQNANVRGSVIWWIYYKYALGIEFVDERANGTYKIRDYTGDFFGAMELFKLGGWVGPDSVFKAKAGKFELRYDPGPKELEVLLPAKDVQLKENNDGKLEIDLDFKFYIYGDKGKTRETFTDSRSYIASSQDFEALKTIPFRFAKPLTPGTHFVDVIVKGRAENSGKIRKLFEIKVK